jgi:hypothetical protein
LSSNDNTELQVVAEKEGIGLRVIDALQGGHHPQLEPKKIIVLEDALDYKDKHALHILVI